MQSSARLVGDCKTAVIALTQSLKGFKSKCEAWRQKLQEKSVKNIRLNE